MKKFFYLLTLVLTTAMFIACEPDDNDWQRPDEPQVQNHSFYMSDAGAVHQFSYAFDANLKSTLGDTVIRYIKFVSYYSHDDGQRNINEIELFDTTGLNFLYGDTLVTFSSNRDAASNEQPENVADSNYTNINWDGRWASNRHPDEYQHMQVDTFSQAMNALFASIENNDTLTDDQRLILLDSIVNTTVYPDFDTVWFQVDLNRVVRVESIVFYLGEHTQVFDIWVSSDGLTWTLLKPEDGYQVIYKK